jgi:ABC-type sugar transport system ATPase subunit
MEEILRIEHLTTDPNQRRILDVANFNVFKGESIAMMGLSDSGINLFVDVLCGKIQSTSGRIIINEKEAHIQNEAHARFCGIYCISEEKTNIG